VRSSRWLKTIPGVSAIAAKALVLKLDETCGFHRFKIDHIGLRGNFQMFDLQELRVLMLGSSH
jgi:hypothetical protein